MTRLKHERQARRLSQTQLGLAANVAQSDLSQIERGILIPTPNQLERLACVLGVAQHDLLKEVVVVEVRI